MCAIDMGSSAMIYTHSFTTFVQAFKSYGGGGGINIQKANYV
jgi:hypothetical protein